MNIQVTASTIYQRVRSIFDKISHIPDEEWYYGEQFLYQKNFKKNAFLIRAGEVTENSFVILKGLVRDFYILESGKEYNTRFNPENTIAGSFSSMVLKLPSRFYIQALEDTETVVLNRTKIEELYERHPCWERLGRLMAEYAMIKKEQRDNEILDSLETRYLRFLDESPDLMNRIPQYHIASYLGVTDVALSRLRKRINLI